MNNRIDGSREQGAGEGVLCRRCIIIIVLVVIVAAAIGYYFGPRVYNAIIGHPQ